jgi:hypothetical protein
MSKGKQDPSLYGWVQVIVGLAIALTATTGASHNDVTTPRSPTVCVQSTSLMSSHLVT